MEKVSRIVNAVIGRYNGMGMLWIAAYLFGMTFVVAIVLMPLCMSLARRLGFIDLPGPRKIHSQPTPCCGGWAVFASISVVTWGHLLAVPLIRGTSWEGALPPIVRLLVNQPQELVLKILPVYGGMTAIFLLGLWDDVKNISVKSRFWIQVALGIGLAFAGLTPDLGFLPRWVAIPVGILWLVGITNSFNFLDGLDGLSCGVATVCTAALLTIMGLGRQPDWTLFLAVQAGALVAFLRYNWHPAKAFLGSSGSLTIGYLLAVSTLMISYATPASVNPLIPVFTPVFILAIPLYDTASVVLIRLVQRRHITIGDQSHFHHRLLRVGFSHRQTVTFIILMAIAFALSAVRLVDASLQQSIISLMQILALLAILVLAERVASNIRKKDAGRALRKDEHVGVSREV